MTGSSSCCAPGGGGSRGDTRPDEASGSIAAHQEFARVVTAAARRAKMVRIAGGTFLMGNEDDRAIPGDGEGPVRTVELRPFLIERRCVTNAQFAAFVRATGYVTEAEQFGWSFVFEGLLPNAARPSVMDARIDGAPWWLGVRGAQWRQPEGPGSSIGNRWRHPAVHVSWNDAQAYATWAGCRLPTEAEWEMAARGGLVQNRYSWGEELTPGGRHHANIWQGTFPSHNSAEDGFFGTAPVDAFPPNGFSLYQMSGNVWEWCWDRFSADWHASAREETRRDPRGPAEGPRRVVRGGSYLCHISYCERYRVAARTGTTPDSSTGHTGFRLVSDVASDDLDVTPGEPGVKALDVAGVTDEAMTMPTWPLP